MTDQQLRDILADEYDRCGMGGSENIRAGRAGSVAVEAMRKAYEAGRNEPKKNN